MVIKSIALPRHVGLSSQYCRLPLCRHADRDDLRQPLRDLCQDLDLKGTILLAHEGINFFLAGSQSSIVHSLNGSRRSSIHQYTTQDFILRLSAISPDECPLEKGDYFLGLDHIKPAEMTGEEITPKAFKQASR